GRRRPPGGAAGHDHHRGGGDARRRRPARRLPSRTAAGDGRPPRRPRPRRTARRRRGHVVKIALAMAPGLVDAAFDDRHWSRLSAVGDVVREVGAVDGADVLLGHWGCPPLDDAFLARMPDLRLFAYAAGTVKE